MKTVKDAYESLSHSIDGNSGAKFIFFNPSRLSYGYSYWDGVRNGEIICTYNELADYAKTQKLNSINKEAVKINNNIKIHPESKGFVSKAIDEAAEIIKKDMVKPVYTQEMADNRELPPVGVKCLLLSMGLTYFNKEVEITYIGDGVGCYKYIESNKEYSFSENATIFKPIDTRTDKEKLIDEVAELINDHIDDDVGSKCLAKEIINKLK